MAAFSTNALSAAGTEALAPAVMLEAGDVLVPCAAAAPVATTKARPMLAERAERRLLCCDMRLLLSEWMQRVGKRCAPAAAMQPCRHVDLARQCGRGPGARRQLSESSSDCR